MAPTNTSGANGLSLERSFCLPDRKLTTRSTRRRFSSTMPVTRLPLRSTSMAPCAESTSTSDSAEASRRSVEPIDRPGSSASIAFSWRSASLLRNAVRIDSAELEKMRCT